MGLRIYNTLTGRKEEFVPLAPGEVKMYVCGPTVYDYCHLGHGRAYVAFDVIYRYLMHKGYKVTYVRNITDIDDKIIARAGKLDLPGAELREKVSALTRKYLDAFSADMETLGLLLPGYEPKATEYIPHMIELIKKLIKNGLAYEVNGNVYYEVSGFSNYGRLSGRSPDELLTAGRLEPDPDKRALLDFSLWKRVKPREPWWDSPWGRGRPGWHIECSSMSLSLLGEVFDIHGGGQDLIFPHHENEIAQSRGATGKEPVMYWVHNGFVTIDKEKMSKSLGNFFTLREIFRNYRPEIVRFFLLSRHYRSPVDFSDALLDNASAGMGRITDCLQRARVYLEGKKPGEDVSIKNSLAAKFNDVMDDDFNTAQAVALAFDIVKDINNGLKEGGEPGKIFTRQNALKEILSVLGIKYSLPGMWRVGIEDELEAGEGELEKQLALEKLETGDAVALVKMRHYYRRTKQWALSDRIREFLGRQGYILRDGAGVSTIYER